MKKRFLLLLAAAFGAAAMLAGTASAGYATWDVQTNSAYSLVYACNTVTGACGSSRTDGSGWTFFHTDRGQDTYYTYADNCVGGGYYLSGTQYFVPQNTFTINLSLGFQHWGC